MLLLHHHSGPASCVVNETTVVEEIWQGDCYLMGRFFIMAMIVNIIVTTTPSP